MFRFIIAASAALVLLASASAVSAQTSKVEANCPLGKSMTYTYGFQENAGRPLLSRDLEYIGQKCEKGLSEKYVMEGFPLSGSTLKDLSGKIRYYDGISMLKRELGPKFDEALDFMRQKRKEADAATAPLKVGDNKQK